MEKLRTPFLIIALGCCLAVVGAELASPLLLGLDAAKGQAPPGVGISALAFLDILLLFVTLLCALPLILPESLHAKLQGVATLVVAILVILAGIVAIFIFLAKLLLMIGLLLAIPFGTIAYFIMYADFPTGAAQTVLGGIYGAKMLFCICLVLAQQRFLQNKGLVLLTLCSLLGNLIVGFLHGLVPGFLVSITDAIAAIVVVIIAIIWAILLAIGSLPAILKAVNVTKNVG